MRVQLRGVKGVEGVVMRHLGLDEPVMDLVVNAWMCLGGRDSRREVLVSGPQVVGGEEVPDYWAGGECDESWAISRRLDWPGVGLVESVMKDGHWQEYIGLGWCWAG